MKFSITTIVISSLLILFGCKSSDKVVHIDDRFSYTLDCDQGILVVFDKKTNASVSLDDHNAGFSFDQCNGSIHVGSGGKNGNIYISKKFQDGSFKVVIDESGDLEWDKRMVR